MIMIGFVRTQKNYKWNVEEECEAILDEVVKENFDIPESTKGQLLCATWNIANFGYQKRHASLYKIIASIIKIFDLIAIQEISTNLKPFYQLMGHLKEYSYIITDVGGNNERLCYIYKKKKIKCSSLIGELSMPYSWRNRKKPKFKGFDRNPYIASWECDGKIFTTYNCHMYFGGTGKKYIDRRCAEILTLTKYVSDKSKTNTLFSNNIIILGDMNTPNMIKNNKLFRPIAKYFKALRYNDHFPTYSNIADNSTYDQIALLKPFTKKIRCVEFGVFAWDNAVFRTLWNKLGKECSKDEDLSAEDKRKKRMTEYQKFAKWAISDHRPVWALFEFNESYE